MSVQQLDNLHLLDDEVCDDVPVLVRGVSHERHGTVIYLDDVLGIIFTNNSLQGADGQATKHRGDLQTASQLLVAGIGLIYS